MQPAAWFLIAMVVVLVIAGVANRKNNKQDNSEHK